MKTKRLAFDAMMIAFAMILSYVESIIPIYIGIPGAKIGLPNLIILIVLLRGTIADAVLVNLLRIILTGFLFGNLYGILYSIAGAAFSLGIMIACSRSRFFSVIGISLAGGVFHNIGQLVIAAVVVQTAGVFYYMPFLLVAGAATGILIGIVVKLLLKHLSKLTA